MMKQGLLILVLLCAGLLMGCSQQQAPAESLEDTDTIKRTAFFQDLQENRILVFAFAAQTPVEEIRSHAEGLSYAQDRLLAAYYFVEGSNKIDPTALRRAHTIMNANDLLFDAAGIDPWHYAFMRPFVGEVRFTDCRETPDDILCRAVGSDQDKTPK